MSNVSFLEKLLDGAEVTWLPLGDIADIYGGLTGKSKADFENGNATYISYKNIFNNLEINFSALESVKVSASEKQHRVKYGDVIFTGSSEMKEESGMSSTVTKKLKDNIYLNSFSFGVRFNKDICLIPEFSKYLFRSHLLRKEIAKTANGVTRFNISKAKFKKIKIPILYPDNPKKSMEIQTEIVRILDAFTTFSTELTAELTAELTDRKIQYNYYRDQLFTFDEGDIEWKPLSELGDLVRGNGLPKKDFTETGVPAIHYGQIYTYYGLSTESTLSFVSFETAEKLKKVNKGDVIITNTSENFEDVGTALAYLGEEQAVTGGHATIFKPNNWVLGKYFAYFTQTTAFKKAKRKYAKGEKVIDVSANDMSKIEIPIPYPDDFKKSINEQKRIVDILDKFDALINSISKCLPYEIELRNKQYEYYRDLLLNFPKPEEEVA